MVISWKQDSMSKVSYRTLTEESHALMYKTFSLPISLEDRVGHFSKRKHRQSQRFEKILHMKRKYRIAYAVAVNSHVIYRPIT